jgi:uncharacterized coiled-coil protein SlyX
MVPGSARNWIAAHAAQQPQPQQKMKPKNTTTPHLRKSTGPVAFAARFSSLAFACFALSPMVQAVSPAPDGGYPNENTAEGDFALNSLTSGSLNTALGFQALLNNTTGTQNTANGVNALFSNTTGSNNTANGINALLVNKTGNGNIAEGDGALGSNTGSFNTAVGFNAGANLTTGSNNIDVGSLGVAGESNTIRIGGVKQTATYITGISGAIVASGATVIVGSDGHLGTVVSSERFKNAIKPMDKASEAILALKPVTFRYKHELDPKGIPQFGLVAEQVEKVNPDLVARDADGKVYSVRYEAVNAMLLNEFLKEHRKVQEQEGTVAQLKSNSAKQEPTIGEVKSAVARLETTIAKQEAMIEQQQKGMETLAATLKEQASQIQKVSAQVELNKPAPQIVADNQ